MTAFWDIAPCSLVEVDRRFRGANYLHHQGLEYGLVAVVLQHGNTLSISIKVQVLLDQINDYQIHKLISAPWSGLRLRKVGVLVREKHQSEIDSLHAFDQVKYETTSAWIRKTCASLSKGSDLVDNKWEMACFKLKGRMEL
jgi:hypothetical protein